MTKTLNAISVCVAVIILGVVLLRLVPIGGPEVIFVNPGSSGYALNRVIHEIQKARSSIDVAMYMLTNGDIIRALRERERAGVALRILYGESSELPGTRVEGLHMKLMIIDKKTAVVGSANFTEAGFGWNQEVILIMRAGDLNQYFRRGA